MHRWAPQFGAFVVTLVLCARVLAHGGAPVAYAVLSHDAEGPRALSFNTGLALRRSTRRYQFVCPAAWNDQFPAPLAALPDGTVVAGATRGLMLLDDTGVARAHPDPAAIGRSSELVRTPRGVVSLRPTPEGSEVLAIDAQTVRVLWKDAASWSSIAATEDKLVLVSANNRIVQMVTISAADGVEIERQSAVMDAPVDYVFARASYALVVFRNGSMTLGSLSMQTFTRIADAALSIVGPLRSGDATLLALDGKLTQLSGSDLLPLADDHNVVCLGEHDGLLYACEREGISRLTGQVVGEPVFRFGWLEPPALERVAEGEPRMLCNAQWQDFLLDMQLAMLDFSNAADASLTAAVSAQLPAAGAAASGAAADAGQQPFAHIREQRVQEQGSRCSSLPGANRSSAAARYLFAFALILTWVRCRRHSV